MPYPFAPSPSWDEFKEQLRRLGVSFIEEEGLLPGGEVIKAQYFEHVLDGRKLRCEVTISDGEELLTPSMILYVCRRLAISPALFGLELD